MRARRRIAWSYSAVNGYFATISSSRAAASRVFPADASTSEARSIAILPSFRFFEEASDPNSRTALSAFDSSTAISASPNTA